MIIRAKNLYRWRLSTILIFSISCSLVGLPINQNPEPKLLPYKYTISVCAMFQNEGPYLKEWIEFHKLVGVQHFYLYDNNIGPEVDNYKEVLAPYIKSGQVELIPWPYSVPGKWIEVQYNAYQDALKRAVGQTKWLAFLDLDEFLTPVRGRGLEPLLKDYEQYGGVVVDWQIYGTSNVERIPKDKLMIEMLLLKAPQNEKANFRGKSIVRPEYAERCRNPHLFKYKRGYFCVYADKTKVGTKRDSVCVDRLRINHYWTRHNEFFTKVKIARRQRWGSQLKAILERAQISNQVKDDIMLKFVRPLRKAMGLR